MPQTIQIFTFLFLTPGYFIIHGPFAKIVRGADHKLTPQIALCAIVFSGIALGLMIVYNALNKLFIVHQ